MTTSQTALLATMNARINKASKPGGKDEAAFEAARCHDAIEEHTEAPRDFSPVFVARQWARIDALLA